jgi:hypothetical protein
MLAGFVYCKFKQPWLLASTKLNSLIIFMAIYFMVNAYFGLCSKHHAISSFFAIVCLIIPINYFVTNGMKNIENQVSEKDMAQYVLLMNNPSSLFLYQDFEKISSFLFYTQKRLAIIDSQSDDLLYGSSTSSAKGWFYSTKDFVELAKIKPINVVLLSKKLPEFIRATAPLNFRIVYQKDNVLLLSNTPSI